MVIIICRVLKERIIILYKSHQRRVNLFKPLPQSLITGFFGYLNGCIAEYKEP
jgi:hypothetical protein